MDSMRLVNTFAGLCVSHQLLHEGESKPVTTVVSEFQLQLYGDVVYCLDIDLAHSVFA